MPVEPPPRDAAGNHDCTRFHPAFFQHLETRVLQPTNLGIQAGLILFHPYDRWGYQNMPAQVDDRCLRYTVARLAAFRNVWWSLAAVLYDHARPWVTHASIQSADSSRTEEWLQACRKPVILRLAGLTWVTARFTCMPRTFCGGPRAASSTGKAPAGSPSCAASSKKAPSKASR